MTQEFVRLSRNNPWNGCIEEGNLLNGKKEGTWHVYHKGIICLIENWKNGIKEGLQTTYLGPRSKIYNTEMYVNNIRNGECISYYCGTMISKEIFKNDVRHGSSITYHDNGHVRSIGTYNNGKRIGNWEFYDSNGCYTYSKYYDSEHYDSEQYDSEQYDSEQYTSPLAGNKRPRESEEDFPEYSIKRYRIK